MGLGALYEIRHGPPSGPVVGEVTFAEDHEAGLFSVTYKDPYGFRTIHFSTETLLPMSVEYRDAERDMRIVYSNLSEYQPLRGIDPEVDANAVIPTHITITSDIEEAARIQIVVRDAGVTAPGGQPPNPQVFKVSSVMRSMRPDTIRVVDAGADQPSMDLDVLRAMADRGELKLEEISNLDSVDFFGISEQRLVDLLKELDAYIPPKVDVEAEAKSE
jgi:hypothetical protein